MHSYKTLAVLALAASTASPAFSAPVQENQQQTRASVAAEEAAADAGGSLIGTLAKTIGLNALLGVAPVAVEHFFGGNSSRRALPHDEDTPTHFEAIPRVGLAMGNARREPLDIPEGLASSLGKSLLGAIVSFGAADATEAVLNHTRREPLSIPEGLASTLGKSLLGALVSFGAADATEAVLNHTRREPSPLNFFKEVGKGVKSLLGGGKKLFPGRDDHSSQDLIHALQSLHQKIDELD